MRVKTFDLMTGESMECELRSFTISGLATLETDDKKTVVRHLNRCEYNKNELKEWMDKR